MASRTTLKLVLAAVVVIAAAVAIRFLPLHLWLREVDVWVDTLGAVGPVVFAAIYVAALLLLLPRSPLTVASGFLFGFELGVLLSLCAATLAASLAFLGARYLWRARVQTWAAGHPKAQAVDQAVSEHGWKVVVLLRLSPIVHYGLSNYFYGVMSIRFWPFFWAGILGTLPGTLLAVSVGAAGHHGLTGPHHLWRWVYLGAGALATVAASAYFAQLARRALRSVSDGTGRPR